eukprot:212823_1
MEPDKKTMKSSPVKPPIETPTCPIKRLVSSMKKSKLHVSAKTNRDRVAIGVTLMQLVKENDNKYASFKMKKGKKIKYLLKAIWGDGKYYLNNAQTLEKCIEKVDGSYTLKKEVKELVKEQIYDEGILVE